MSKRRRMPAMPPAPLRIELETPHQRLHRIGAATARAIEKEGPFEHVDFRGCAHPECGDVCLFRDETNTGAVHHPRHYNIGKIEVIDAIDAWGLGFDDGNAVKYIARARHKGKEREDLEKALWYLQHRIDQITKTQPPMETQS